MTPYSNNTSKRRRAGFTLIEILVVVGIIALLASLSLMAYRGFINGARVRATQTTIRKIDELLHKRMDAFNRWLDTMHVAAPGRPDYVFNSDYGPMTQMGFNVGDPTFRDVAMVIARKNRFREFFPQNFSEVPSNPEFPGTGSAANQDAECLYWLIMNSQVFGVEPVDDGFFQASEFGDTDGDGLMEFLDSWGNPIRFYRWPTRLVAHADASSLMGSIAMTVPINGADGQPGVAGDDDDGLLGVDDPNERGWPGSDDPINDPDDPNGFIPDLLQQLSANGTPWDFESINTPSISGLPFHSPATYHAPLIVSAGPDGSGPGGGGLGLWEPEDVANYGHLAQPKPDVAGEPSERDKRFDNITNLNSRAGGP